MSRTPLVLRWGPLLWKPWTSSGGRPCGTGSVEPPRCNVSLTELQETLTCKLSKAIEVGLPKALQIKAWAQCVWMTEYGVKEDSGALNFNIVFPVGFWTCSGPVTLFSHLLHPLGVGTYLLCYPTIVSYKRVTCDCILISQVPSWTGICLRMNLVWSLTRIWFRWDWTFKLVLEPS